MCSGHAESPRRAGCRPSVSAGASSPVPAADRLCTVRTVTVRAWMRCRDDGSVAPSDLARALLSTRSSRRVAARALLVGGLAVRVGGRRRHGRLGSGPRRLGGSGMDLASACLPVGARIRGAGASLRRRASRGRPSSARRRDVRAPADGTVAFVGPGRGSRRPHDRPRRRPGDDVRAGRLARSRRVTRCAAASRRYASPSAAMRRRGAPLRRAAGRRVHQPAAPARRRAARGAPPLLLMRRDADDRRHARGCASR